MAWGGSLNKEGSAHLRILRETDKVLKFLEGFKQKLNEKEKQKISEVIDIIVQHHTKKSEEENKT